MQKKLRILFIIAGIAIFIIAGFVFIENPVYSAVYGFIYPRTKINPKSDKELVTQFQAHKEEFNLLPQKESQYIEIFRLERENEKKAKENKTPQLITERQKRAEIDTFVSGLLNSQDFRLYSNADGNLKYAQSYNRSENRFLKNCHDIYFLDKGLILFGENNQPDQQYVFDNLDNFHSSGNIKLTAQKFVKKFGHGETVYAHLEGNWYLFLKVSLTDCYPNDPA